MHSARQVIRRRAPILVVQPFIDFLSPDDRRRLLKDTAEAVFSFA